MSSKQYEINNTKYRNSKYRKLANSSDYSCPPTTNYYKDINGGDNCICSKADRTNFDVMYKNAFGKPNQTKPNLPPKSDKKLGWLF